MLHALYLVGKHEGIGLRGLFKGVQSTAINGLFLSTGILALYEPLKQLYAKMLNYED